MKCWCCWGKYEFTSWRKLWEDKAKCFYCRIDYMDYKYGPSQQAEMWRLRQKNKEYNYAIHRHRTKLAIILKQP